MSTLVELWRNRSRSSADVKRLALKHIDDIDRRLHADWPILDDLVDGPVREEPSSPAPGT